MKNETILSGEAGLAGIQWALKSRPARQMLRKALLQMASPGCAVGPLQLTRAKYKPLKRLQAYYTFTITQPETGETRSVPVAVTWRKPGNGAVEGAAQEPEDMRPVVEMQEAAQERGLLAPFQCLQWDVKENGILLQIWPLDPVFPQLVRLGSTAYAPRLLSTAGVTASEQNVKVTPLRYRPGERHVLRYQIDVRAKGSAGTAGSPETERLYAKLYKEPQAAARAYRIANRVVDWLDESVPGFHGVRPAGMREEDAVILYPHAAGTPLSQQLRRSPAWLSRQLRLVGAALASLHSGPETLALELEENTLEKEARVIARANEHLQVLLPEAGARVMRILDRALELHTRLPKERPTFTHSDFKSDHLLISPAGMTLIDFDTCALADPALDIGKFLADLEWWHAITHTPGFEAAQAEFIQGYTGTPRVPGTQSVPKQDYEGRFARARIYHALILAKITIRRTRLYWNDWAAVTTKMIQRSAAILQNQPAE